jgi:choline dehydrogenase-like flavoprotein
MSTLTTKASRSREGRARADADGVVIGAGFAGLVAARELGRAGLGVLVLGSRRSWMTSGPRSRAASTRRPARSAGWTRSASPIASTRSGWTMRRAARMRRCKPGT